MARIKLTRRLCWVMPELRLESEANALRFCSLQTLVFDEGDVAEVGCEPDPPVDVGLAPLVAEAVEVPPPDEPELLPPEVRLPVMSAGEARFDTGGPGKMYTAPSVYTSGSKMPGSLSLYAPGKETVWLGVPVCEPPTRICVQDG